jgi:hypothetical protein
VSGSTSGGAAGDTSTGGSGGGTGGTGSAGRASGGGGAGGSGGASATGGAAGGAPGKQIIVDAGSLARDHTIVSFPLPGSAGKSLALRDAQGTMIPLQVAEDGTATFILPALAAGKQATFTIAEVQAPEAAIKATEQGKGVDLKIGTTNVFRFHTQGELPAGVGANRLRGGYIHPFYTPAGVEVTADYPSDHQHHHGIWSAWTSTTFNGHHVDFWNMQSNEGKVDFQSLERTWQGPVHAGFSAKLVHVDLVPATDVTALNERWVVTAYKTHDASPPYLVFDLHSTQEAATTSPLQLETYHYGGFAIRGRPNWGGAPNATFLTSEGRTRANGDDTDGRWLYIGGASPGGVVGYAILGHPSNFRAPQGFRIHPDDPYAAVLPVSAKEGGGFNIEPGRPYISRFRFVSTDGAANAALFNRIWDDFATPPTVTVQAGP